MNRWQHLRAGLVSRVDWMVSMIENHEALADSAIGDLQRHAARAKVQMGRVREDGRNLRERLDEERAGIARWRDRAKRLADSDRERALACLARSKNAERRAKEFEERVSEHERIETQLAGDIRRVEERLEQLRTQRNLMRTRQSRAEALAAVGECSPGAELDEVFDRWNARITERELVAGCSDSGDRLAFELTQEEADEALRDELEELLASQENDEPKTPRA